ncbi:MAG TPA: RNA polymerase sigma factor [Vicinamibacterales bacterium]|nr:RNA polymerase sigma factor [Vicinamibacterales bacterium]
MEGIIDERMADEREARYLRLLGEHECAVHRLAASYEREPARRQDLVQEIWLALWQALPAFRGDCAERTFVFRIAHNRAVSHVQHWRRRRTETLDGSEPIPAATPDPEHAATERQRRERLQAAVLRLPLGLRQAIVLRLEGLSQREIGDVLGISENNVAVRLTRARAALALQLESSGDRS